MKKIIYTLLMTVMVAATVPLLSTTASAQTRSCNTNRNQSRSVYRNYEGGAYNNAGYNTAYDAYGNRVYNQAGYGTQTVYDRHRKAINIGVGTGAGALLGALVGGGKGALIGAAVGAGGGYVVTQHQNPRNYYRYRR